MRDRVVFYLNGVRREVGAEAALRTLADFLRGEFHPPKQGRLTATKVACSEGDCGSCTVLVGTPAAQGEGGEELRLEYRPIDSCIAFVFQMDGRHVVTVEGLARGGGLTGVQSAMVEHHGSQCGFCTPGFVMAMHGLAESRRRVAGCDWPPGDEEVRVGLSGNLCRCTGYWQILEAAAAIEPAATPALGDLFPDQSMAEDLAARGRESVRVSGEGPSPRTVAIPRSAAELIGFRATMPDATLVAGATDIGVQHNHGRIAPRRVLATGCVPELRSVGVEGNELVIGAAATWDEIARFVRERVPEYHRVLLRFGSPQVRNLGTLVGNLANASPIGDSLPFHYVTESIVEVASLTGGIRQIPIADFYRGYKQIDLGPTEVVQRVRTPLPADGVGVKLYKISKRRDMDISTVTAAFWLRREGGTIVEARVAVGGVGPVVLRLRGAERELIGRSFSLESHRRAGAAARAEVAPITDVRGSAAYRLRLVENLFAKCYHDIEPHWAVSTHSP